MACASASRTSSAACDNLALSSRCSIDTVTATHTGRDRVLSEIFSEGGPLATQVQGYRQREGQLQMAQAIACAIENQSSLVAEAGTGTGKTFAYLVPALLWGGKVILSTGTKTLQDQLFRRDLPRVREALSAPVTIALLKGRANYVCHYHLARTQSSGRLASPQDVGHLRSIVRFVQSSKTGDRSELSNVPEQASIWAQVTSTRENCLGSECPNYRECFVMQARREAQQADVVVVNHHLFFADLMLRDEGVTDLLPAANTVIFDEAHQLPETASLFFGQTVSTGQMLDLSRDVLAEGLSHARDAAPWTELVARVDQRIRELRLALPMENARSHARQLAPDCAFFPAIEALAIELEAMASVLQSQAERSEGLEQCAHRARTLVQDVRGWVANEAPDTILWFETHAHSVQLHRTPLSVAETFTRQRAGQPRAWIFTSATLAVKSDFSHFSGQLGLADVQARAWPSPFDYGEQGLLYIPEGLPDPLQSGYTQAVVDAALPVIRASGGRAFILCTTLRAVRVAAEYLRECFKREELEFPLLVQGEGSRSELLERFRNYGNAVLVGSQSFWEGVDVRGRALSVVIIDKLPFAPPDDPVLAARLDALAQAGGNPFMDYQLPSVVIALKQGTGRLIRDESDRGILMLCDPRLISRPYGRRIWQSLPPFTRTRDVSAVLRFLDRI